MSSELKNTSLEDKFVPIHKQILAARVAEKKELTIEALRVIHFKVATMHGIDFPDATTDNLCLDLWHRKYKFQMNQKELELAFELNMTGDLGEKKIMPTSYQFFTVDFFTNVVNAYLLKKLQTGKKQQEELDKIEQERVKKLPKYDPTVDIMQRIILDFKEYQEGEFTWSVDDYEFNSNTQFTMVVKLEYIDKMFELNTEVEYFVKLREKALSWLLRGLGKKKTDLRAQSGKPNEDGSTRNFGAIASVANQIARLRSGNLITDSDEIAIQFQVKRLMYHEVLALHKPNAVNGESLDNCEFVNHIKENISIHQNKK